MYDAEQGTVTTALKASSATVFSDDTISKILSLATGVGDTTVRFDTTIPDASGNVTVAAGAEVVYVSTSDTVQTTVMAPVGAPIVIFQGKGGVIATINDGQTTVPASSFGVVDRVVVGTSGNDKIIVADARNSQITLGTGNSTVVAGGGEDTIVAGNGNSTISGGTGHAIVELKGNAADYTVTVQNGHAVVTNQTNLLTTDVTKIQYVQLDNGKALVFANSTQEAAVTTLYETAFGRTADAGGLKYWFDKAAAGESLSQIAVDFTKASEFTAQAALSNADFVNGLYLHTFGRGAEAEGIAYWADALSQGLTRAELISSFSNIAAHNIDGTVQTEATVVGSVTIVTGII